MPRQKVGRLSPSEIRKRVLELETLYGQKNLASRLGVSVDSIRRYREGRTLPQTRNIYTNLNKLYNKNKKLIDAGAVERKQQQIEKRQTAQKRGATKPRFAPIYPDYMYDSPAREFEGVNKWERLEDLSQAGYVAGWYGQKDIPLEVQFVIHGEGINRFGKVLHIVGIVSKEVSPKLENAYTGQDISLEVFSTYFRLIPGLKKDSKFFERMDRVREFFFEGIRIEKGFPMAFLGFYFDELDEM